MGNNGAVRAASSIAFTGAVGIIRNLITVNLVAKTFLPSEACPTHFCHVLNRASVLPHCAAGKLVTLLLVSTVAAVSA